jgi:gluconolactonase
MIEMAYELVPWPICSRQRQVEALVQKRRQVAAHSKRAGASSTGPFRFACIGFLRAIRSARHLENVKAVTIDQTFARLTILMKTTLTILLGLASIGGTAAQFEARDENEFNKIVSATAEVKKLAGDLGFLEGPVWIAEGFLVFSDIPANQLKRWNDSSGLAVFREASNNSNGNTLDQQGRLVTCEHGARRVSRTEKNGMVVALVAEFEGKKLNSPNDVVVKSDGSIWFTDPDYGLAGRAKEVPGNYVFRFDPMAKSIEAVVKDFDKPNGLCFSPDEKKLYVADSGQPKHIRVFEVAGNGSLTNGRVFCKIDKGGPDGIRCDADGRIWSSAGDGIHIFAPDGHLIGKILVPESPANLCFGGKDARILYITARKSLYSIPVLAKGR